MLRSGISLFALLFLLPCCQGPGEKKSFYQSDLFKEVQLAALYPDSKTFADCNPKRPVSEIISSYNKARRNKDFNLRAFVDENFSQNLNPGSDFRSDTTVTLREHIISLWPVLTRSPDDYNPYSSLIPLPKNYIVPGGRFGEVYYWDSYFTQLGLMLSGKSALVTDMVDNFTFLIDSLGFIPNGNRSYYLGRSQPPFYSLMVALVTSDNRSQLPNYLPALEKEYQFWMDGASNLNEGQSTCKRVVRMSDGTILNRYWDNYAEPRPESFKEDVHLAEKSNRDKSQLYRDLRAACESGWDFSSRWFRIPSELGTIHTTEILPVDLNCLLYHLETIIAEALIAGGDAERAKIFFDKAGQRKIAIQNVFWNQDTGFYQDFDFIANQFTNTRSLAGAYPIFFEIATEEQAAGIKPQLENDFLKAGGFVTTLNNTGQQWDSPNGWAPLQWITVKGLMNYGFDSLATAGATRWLKINRSVFKKTGKMVEKYNVVDTSLEAGGGEYPVQDGFGWTNGVALQLMEILDKQTVADTESVNF